MCSGLYYFKSKKLGEVDFVVDRPDGRVLPVEVKSGKDYHRFRGISNVLDAPARLAQPLPNVFQGAGTVVLQHRSEKGNVPIR